MLQEIRKVPLRTVASKVLQFATAIGTGVLLTWISFQFFQHEASSEPHVRYVDGTPDAEDWDVFLANDGNETFTVYRIIWGVHERRDSADARFVECTNDPEISASDGSLVVHAPPGQITLLEFTLPLAEASPGRIGCQVEDRKEELIVSSETVSSIYVRFWFSDQQSDWHQLFPFTDEQARDKDPVDAPPLPSPGVN